MIEEYDLGQTAVILSRAHVTKQLRSLCMSVSARTKFDVHRVCFNI